MSLIHEALQKAEAERRAGELPPLLSAARMTATPSTASPRRWLWIVSALALVAALGYSNRDLIQHERSDTATVPAQQSGKPLEPAPPKAVAAIKPAQVRMQEDSVLPGIPSGVLSTAPAATTTPPAEIETAVDPRREAPIVPAEEKAPPVSVASNDADELHAHTPEPVADPPVRMVDVPRPEMAVQPEPTTKPSPEQTPISRPDTATAPYVFELPLATRQALPALKVTMQVYHADPAQRFAIIDGKRVNENGVAGNELNLIEIQRDAMMFEFRGTRFLLPRLGR